MKNPILAEEILEDDESDGPVEELFPEKDYRPLDFDHEDYDNELEPSLEDYLNAHLDEIEENTDPEAV